MTIQQFKNKLGETVSHIGGGNVRFTKNGPHRPIELRLRERDATETTNSTVRVDVLKDDVSIGKIYLSREGIAELLDAYRRLDESVESARPAPRAAVDLSAFARPNRSEEAE
jgi:hypothetical protein